MKLKRLAIHNIASIADATIDFGGEILSSEPIFLICGETGSGKTMILDSICLALYNDTPRLKQASRSENYTETNGATITLNSPVQYLRKGTGEAFVELDFEAGESLYTARWSVARAHRKPDGNLQQIKWELEDHANKVFMKGSEAESVIGLSFDEFRRTVMLAQGDFTAFLKSKDDEKSRILEKITGTGIYREIGKRISDNFKQTGMALNAKQDAIGSIRESLMDEEAEKAMEEELARLVKDAEGKRAVRESLERLRNTWNRKAEAEAERALHRKSLEDAEAEYSRLSGGLEFAEDVHRNDIKALAALGEKISGESAHEAMYRDAALIIKDLNTISGNRESVRKKKEEAEALKAKRASIESELASKTALVKADEDGCKKILDMIRILSAKRDSIGPDKMRALKELLEKIETLQENAAKLTASVSETEGKIGVCRAREKELSYAWEASRKHFEATDLLYGRMKETDEQWARNARAALRVGDICPVCGHEIPSQEYLDSISDEHFRSILAPVRQELDKAREETDRLYRELTAKTSEAKALEGILSGYRDELAKAGSLLEESLKRKAEGGFAEMSVEQVRGAISEADALTREIEGLNSRLSGLSAKVVAGKEAIGKLSTSIESFKAKTDSLMAAAEETVKQTDELAASLDGRITIPGWKENWEANPSGFVKSLSDASARYIKETGEVSVLTARIDKVAETVGLMASIRDSIIAKDVRFKDLPAGKREKVAEQPALWSALNERVASAIAGIASAESRTAACTEAISELEASLAEIYPDGISSGMVPSAMLGKVTEEASELDRSIGSMKRQLETNRSNRLKYARDMEEIVKLKEAYDRWKALNDVFGKKDGEYFQKIAQGYIMNDILGRANEFLRDMTKRYVLESQPGSLGITIRDMEQGGVIRSTSTISGGEGFIISLALALGLSSMEAGGNVTSDILFIDEGFGTLSDGYLDTVTETLQRLNEKGGRKVGIISHVKELRERIGAKITVTKTSPTESSVTVTR